jgi:transposase
MRRSIDSLCTLISDQLSSNPAEGHLFVFRNKSGNKLKCLYYEANCFSLLYHRLEKGRFVFPKDKNVHIEMTHDHFKWLLASDKYTQCLRITTYFEGYFQDKSIQNNAIINYNSHMKIATNDLPTATSELHEIIVNLKQELATEKLKNSYLLEQFRLARQARFAPSAEKNIYQ